MMQGRTPCVHREWIRPAQDGRLSPTTASAPRPTSLLHLSLSGPWNSQLLSSHPQTFKEIRCAFSRSVALGAPILQRTQPSEGPWDPEDLGKFVIAQNSPINAQNT